VTEPKACVADMTRAEPKLIGRNVNRISLPGKPRRLSNIWVVRQPIRHMAGVVAGHFQQQDEQLAAAAVAAPGQLAKKP